jgi:hypothetical protein
LVHESTSALQQQAEAQKQLREQLDAAAKSIVDYVNNLFAGSQSTLSPQNRLNAAQATYNATYALAQQGNIDALNRVTSDFENLRQAAHDFFGSSAGYQDILQAGVSQLLSLPAVTTSSDPVVAAVRDVVTAVQQTTGAVTTDTAQTTARLDTAIVKLADAVNNLGFVIGRLDSNNSTNTSNNNLLLSINGLQNTASQQLTLLNNNLTITGSQASGSGTSAVGIGVPGTTFTANNNLLTALNKIVVNTAAIAFNTYILNQVNGWSRLLGTFETGGTLGAGQLGIMGEHHPQGPFLIRAGAYPIPISPAMPQIGAGANDNAAIYSMLRSLQEQLIALQKEVQFNTAVTEEGNRINRSGHAGNMAVVSEQTRRMSEEKSRDRQRANG